MSKDRGGKRRGNRVQKVSPGTEAAAIVQTMPTMPQPGDHQSVQLRKVAAWRAWIVQARQRIGGDTELSNLVLEKIKDRMGLNNPNPARAAETARGLLASGMGDVGLSLRADEAMRRQGIDSPMGAQRLVQAYLDAWNDRGYEALVTRRVGDDTLCVGHRDALRINVWVSGEPGMPDVPLEELDPDA